MKEPRPVILIVDDEDGIRGLLKEKLEQDGYVCCSASDGNSALEVLASRVVDLAVVDILMPGMTGLNLFQHLKERFPDLAVIFLTAVDDAEFAVNNLKGGAYDYIVKPVTRKRLRQAVEGALERRQAMSNEKGYLNLLEEQVVRQSAELESRSRELGALNRVFQTDLSEILALAETS